MMRAPDPIMDARKAAILRAIVSHYVHSGEPVASKTIVEHFPLGVSSATVRNEMVALEEGGYIYQPHTSAGRIPTDSGYRYFVDSWTEGVRLPPAETRRIRRFFGEPRFELEDALRQTASLLSRLTDHAAMVFAPALERSSVRRAELIRLSGRRAMLILVTDTGRVENHVVVIPESVGQAELDRIGRLLNEVLAGVALEDSVQAIRLSMDRFAPHQDTLTDVVRVLDEGLTQRQSEQIFLEGTSTIVDRQKFADLETVRRVIGALEHRRVLIEALADALAQNSVSVRIGSENPAQEMRFCSVVTAPYGSGGHTPLGTLGVVGPTRMDYRRTIAAVYEVASSLGRMLTELGT
jgi:heat-inducible transcriptional repressor